MFTIKQNTLKIKLVLSTTLKTKGALIDSEATENFLNPRAVVKLRLPTEELASPRNILNIDRTNNKAGHITRKCRLKVKLGKSLQEMDFFITDLGQDQIALGYPFLQMFNPTINWSNGGINHLSQITITPAKLWKHCQCVWEKDKKICICKTHFTQRWAADANQKRSKLSEVDIPQEYNHHWKVFSEVEAERLSPTQEKDMHITFKEDASQQLNCKVYPLSKRETGVLHQALDEDLAKEYIRHGTSLYISPIFFIPKKDEAELHMVIDYWQLNEITKKEFYPLPNLWTELKKLSKHHLFSKFDVRASYNNICIAQKDQHKAAFKTPFGTFISTVMTFGFCNAPSIFQHAMNQDLTLLKQKYLNNFSNYMDDVAIGTDNTESERELHRQITHEFLEILKQHSYFLKVSKCEFEKKQIRFLGFLVTNRTTHIDPSKINGISNWPWELKLVKQVRQILDVLGYQRAFIRDYTQLARPLYDLLKKGAQFKWMEACRKSLNNLIYQITKDPILLLADETKPFELEIDASNYGLGAALFQKNKCRKRHTIGYASRTLNKAERNYNIWDKEFLGLIFGLTSWRHLLSDAQHPVQAFVDHANLLHYQHPQKVNWQVAQYILTLADYNLEIHHRPGLLNKANALSRWLDYNDRKEDNKDITPLPSSLFIEALQTTFLSLKVNKSPCVECHDRRDSSRFFHWSHSSDQDSEFARSIQLDELVWSS